MRLERGAIVGGRYRVDRKIADGGMGEVWSGWDRHSRIKVAVKRLRPAPGCQDEVVARFQREAELLARLDCERIGRVHNFVQDSSYGLVIIQEFIEGRALSVLLASRVLSVEEARDLGIDLARGLCALHQARIVHRDLKPGNVLLKPLADGRTLPVIIDLGVSRVLDDAADAARAGREITSEDRALGTIEYMAPEQIVSSHDVTCAADLYALGAILFRAVAGRHVFGDLVGAELARQKLVDEAPPLPTGRVDDRALGLARLVARALRRRAEERPASAEELLAGLLCLRERSSHAALPSLTRPALPTHPTTELVRLRPPPVPPLLRWAPTPAGPLARPTMAAPEPGRRSLRRATIAAVVVALAIGIGIGAALGRGHVARAAPLGRPAAAPLPGPTFATAAAKP